jgi:predicted phosphodiesterase
VRAGLVSDTHGLFEPRLIELFAGCDLLLHAGDVVGSAILRDLARLAPLHAVRGNNDVSRPPSAARSRGATPTSSCTATRIVPAPRWKAGSSS